MTTARSRPKGEHDASQLATTIAREIDPMQAQVVDGIEAPLNGGGGGPLSAVGQVGAGRLLTPEDVAELLQVDRETVYRMARRGELPAIKVARHWRFRAARLERWLRELEDGER